jgi:hypothetical protein
VTHIEFIVEVGGSLSEIALNLTMESKGSLYDWDDLLLNSTLKLGEVLAQEGVVDSKERGLLGEGNSEGPEMSLKARINLEGTSSRVHASSVQSVLNVLKGELVAIIPVLVVLVLSQKRN